MKTSNIAFKIIGGLTLIAILVLQGWGCNKDNSISTSNGVTDNSPSLKSDDGNSYVFPEESHMYGKSYAQWAAEWWKWNLQFDCAHCPLYDVDGSRENQNQGGQVFFLAGRRGNTLSVTVPANVSLFLPLITFESDYPCGDAQPAPGETMEHFLQAETQSSVDAMDQLSLTIDGHAIKELDEYKVVSPMFTIAANGDLANCFDDCITGSSQPFVGGGPFVMLKKLKKGTHTIHRIGGASAFFPFVYDITYNITQL